MRLLFLIISLITLLFPKEVVAVLDLEPKELSKAEADILTQRLTSKLIALDKYVVVERNSVNKILEEQKFQNSGCTDSECAVEIGQLINSDFVVIGNVSKFGDKYAIDARLINVGTGQALESAEFTHKGDMDVLLDEGILSVANQLCGFRANKKMEREVISKNMFYAFHVSTHPKYAKASGWDGFIPNYPEPINLSTNINDGDWKIYGFRNLVFNIFFIRLGKLGGYISYDSNEEKLHKNGSKENNFEKVIDVAQQINGYSEQSFKINADITNKLQRYSLGITHQKIKNTTVYFGLSYTQLQSSTDYKLDYWDGIYDLKLYSLHSYEYIGIDLGLVYIPYLIEQYSGISFNLGYKYDFNLGQGFQIGAGYRF